MYEMVSMVMVILVIGASESGCARDAANEGRIMHGVVVSNKYRNNISLCTPFSPCRLAYFIKFVLS